MNKTAIVSRIFLILFIFSLCCALVTACRRITLERGNRSVSVLVAYSDVQKLSAAGGLSERVWLEGLKDMGVSAVIFTPDELDGAEAAREAGLSVAMLGGEDFGDYPVYFAAGGEDAGYLTERAKSLGVALALVENQSRTGADLPKSYASKLDKVPLVKCLYLYEEYASRYGVLGYEGAEEIGNIIFRATTDRGIRLLWLTPFYNGDKIVTDMSEYAAVLEELSGRLAVQGIKFTKTPSLLPWQGPGAFMLAALYLGVFILAVFLLNTLFKLGRAPLIFLLIASLAASAVLAWFLPGMGEKLMAFAAAALWPMAAAYVMSRDLKRLLGADLPLKTLIARFALLLIVCTAVSSLGGVYVGSILSGTKYMLELESFTGVKLSQLLPLAYACLIIFKDIYHEEGRSIKGDIEDIGKTLRRHGRLKIICIVLALCVAVAVFIMRTGDGMIAVGVLEQRVRNWVEQALYVRPRTKEMLVALPALAAAVLAASRGWKNALLPLGVISAIGFASVCNTFCHIRAELVQSLIRTWLGALIGLLAGVVVIIIVGPVGKRLKSRMEGREKPC